jgi:UrcA family protein
MYMEPRKCQRAVLLALLLVAGAAFGVAQASTAQVMQERVSLKGLDLSTPTGEREFRRRVGIAIRRICESPSGVVAYGTQRQRLECRRQARDGVRRQLQARGIQHRNLVTRN